MKPALLSDNSVKNDMVQKEPDPIPPSEENPADPIENQPGNLSSNGNRFLELFPAWFSSRVAAIVMIVAIAALILFAFVFFIPNGPAFKETRSVKIPPGSSFATTCDSLLQAGILSNRTTFEIAATVTLWRRQIKPGYYEFKESVSNYALLDRLRKGLQTPLRVTIPSGSRPGRVAGVVSSVLEIDSTEFAAALSDPEFAEELGTDTRHLFGYLMPDTYFSFWGTGARDFIRRVKRDFESRITDSHRESAEKLGIDIEEALRMASIIEWETPRESEKRTVSGVYWNRLQTGMRLQADPTVQFALMQRDGGPMRRLLYRDYEFADPYNTYLIDGLPPGPITNPSFTSFEAALNPESHRFFYFVADGTGGHIFSRSYNEHIRRSREYQQIMRERRRAQAQGS